MTAPATGDDPKLQADRPEGGAAAGPTIPAAAASRQYPLPSQGWAAVVVLSGLCVMSLLDRNILVLLADDLSKDMGLTDVQLSLLFGATFSISYAIASLPLGWALDRFPRRRVIYLCVVVWSAGTMACGLAPNYPMLLAARAGVGAGEAGITPGATSILSDMFEPKRLSFPVSIYMASAKAGQSLSLIISAALATIVLPGATYAFVGLELRGWQAIMLMIGAPGILAALAIFLIAEPSRRYQAGSRGNGYGAFFRYAAAHKRMFFASYLGSLCYIATITTVISWSPLFLQRIHGMSVGESGFLLGSTFLVSLVVGGPLHGWYVDRQIARGRSDAHLRHLMWMGLIALPAGVAAYLVPDGGLAIAFLGLFMFTISGYLTMTGMAVTLFTPPPLRAKAFSILVTINSVIGVSAGPAITAFLTERVFQDRMMMGASIALEIAVLVPLASAAFAFSLAPIRARLSALGVLNPD